jgi:hypothetical protein
MVVMIFQSGASRLPAGGNRLQTRFLRGTKDTPDAQILGVFQRLWGLTSPGSRRKPAQSSARHAPGAAQTKFRR